MKKKNHIRLALRLTGLSVKKKRINDMKFVQNFN